MLPMRLQASLLLNASGLVYDTGQLDSQVSAGEFLVKLLITPTSCCRGAFLEAARVWCSWKDIRLWMNCFVSSEVLEPLIKQPSRWQSQV